MRVSDLKEKFPKTVEALGHLASDNKLYLQWDYRFPSFVDFRAIEDQLNSFKTQEEFDEFVIGEYHAEFEETPAHEFLEDCLNGNFTDCME